MNQIRGAAFRITGLVLGIVGTVISITALVFCVIGMRKAHLCKHCKVVGAYK